jgi:hypothetical protein
MYGKKQAGYLTGIALKGGGGYQFKTRKLRKIVGRNKKNVYGVITKKFISIMEIIQKVRSQELDAF